MNYLESKRFDRDSIVRILTKAPTILSLAVKQVDANLGFLQQQFHLSGKYFLYITILCITVV